MRDRTSTQYLDAVYNPGEFIPVKIADNDYGIPYHVGDSKSAAKVEDYVKRATAGAWSHTNPTNGKYRVIRQNEPDGGTSYRMGACYGDELIQDWRCALLESDEKGFEQEWLKIIVTRELPIVALYASGNVSVHALVRVNCKSKEEFVKKANEFKRDLVKLGACEKSLTATRATRLPSVLRADNFAYQKLLYLNPNATGEPILQNNASLKELPSRLEK